MFGRFWQDESGATAIEYGIIVSFVAIGAVTAIGEALKESEKMFEDLAKTFDKVSTP